VLTTLFGPKGDEVTGGWRKLHEELHGLYSLPNIIKMIKEVVMGEMRNAYKMFVERPEGKNNSEDLGVGGRIILK
jgi:hypothetical protein